MKKIYPRPLSNPNQPYVYTWKYEGVVIWVGRGTGMRGVPRPSSGSNAGRPDVLAKLVANIWSKIDYTILPCKTVKESIKLEEATIASLKPKYNRAPGTGGFKGMHSIEGRKRISDHQKIKGG